MEVKKMEKGVIIFGAFILSAMVGMMIGAISDSIFENWDLAKPKEPLLYKNGSPQESLKDYYHQAQKEAEIALEELDIAYQGAKQIWKDHHLLSERDIKNFFEKADFGECRHRALYGYWLLKQIYKDKKDIKVVLGYLYLPEMENSSFHFCEKDQLDFNHMWLKIDGEIFDPSLNLPVSEDYHPYYHEYVEIWFEKTSFKNSTYYDARYSLNFSEIEKQYKYDKGLLNLSDPSVPSWWRRQV